MTKRFNTLLSISTCAATHWESGTGIFTSGCGIPMLGRAVRVDPIKPTMIAPGIMCLKLRYDKMLSNFAFKSILRHYSLVSLPRPSMCRALTTGSL